jgi:magnesium chelatase subunit I
LNDASEQDYTKALNGVPGLADLVKKYFPKVAPQDKLMLMEFLLHGLSEFSMLSKNSLTSGLRFKDLFSSVFKQGSEN